ncbi:MAG: hypothetical protein M3511_07525, partial [Deinococcota bacterium]|nr:hypothetical protein [Deinococcota bacterium]
TVRLSSWEVAQGAEEIVLSLEAQSSLWRRKVYRFRCRQARFRFEVEVEGQRHLTDVHYFGGYYSGQIRWGSGFFWSGQHFKRGFNPEPTTDEQYHFKPSASSLIDLTGVPLAGKDGWFFTPPPYLFAFEYQEGWLGVGLEAAAGENRYTDFHYRAQRRGFCLTLAFEGHTAVSGRYTLPAIGFDFAPGPYEALAAHVESLRGAGHAPQVTPEQVDWWHSPIFCGWGSQCYLASTEQGRAPDYARQAHYEGFLRVLEANGALPGTLVLDDKWQKTYGENDVDTDKWPDLKGFIGAQHRAGRKVLLWLKAWDPEGLPAEECVVNAGGVSVAFDPSSPAFERRLRASVRAMLLDYGADGFKLDFTARLPSGPGLKSHGDVWGLELMKRYLSILYGEAKKARRDALVMSHTPHPYLADVLDMIRLNDVNTAQDIGRAMSHRARVAALACPNAVIDTDNWPMPNKAAWRDYLRLQPELGVPSLYYASHIDATGEALEEEDYRLIREVWDRHRQGLEGKARP